MAVKENNKQYKVHLAYIDDKGIKIEAGIYDAKDIDYALAKQRTVITPVNSGVVVEVEKVKDTIPTNKYDADPNFPGRVKETVMEGNMYAHKLNTIKINTVEESELIKVKHIGKRTANSVINERENTWFSDYNDLNKRVPLPKGKRWEELIDIDFESQIKVNNLNNIHYY